MKGSIILELILNVSRPEFQSSTTEDENLDGVVVTWLIICFTLIRIWLTQLPLLLVYRPILSKHSAWEIF
jgi:hypothetical protein